MSPLQEFHNQCSCNMPIPGIAEAPLHRISPFLLESRLRTELMNRGCSGLEVKVILTGVSGETCKVRLQNRINCQAVEISGEDMDKVMERLPLLDVATADVLHQALQTDSALCV